MSKEIECPLQSVASAMASMPNDWSSDHREAWIFGIVQGWDEALPEVAAKHRWDSATVARLERLRAKWVAMEGDK